MADNEQQAAVRASLRQRADQVSTRVPAPGEKAAPARTAPAAKPVKTPTARAVPVSQGGGAGGKAPAPRGPGRPPGSRNRTPGLPRPRAGRGQPPSYRNYQAIMLAEFVAAELLVAATPIAVRKNSPGLSPYVPRDMTKLLAIGVLFFLLQLVATTGRAAGRFGAWFGLLILLAVGLNEAANVVKVLDLFSGIADKITGVTSTITGKGGGSGAGALPGNAGVSSDLNQLGDAFNGQS